MERKTIPAPPEGPPLRQLRETVGASGAPALWPLIPLIVVLLMCSKGCTAVRATGTPSSSEDWAVRCLRISEREAQPETIPEDFARCADAWKAWEDAQPDPD